MTKYIPKPIDTDNINLSPDLTALTEILAENIHDHWAKDRAAEGWVYGLKKDGDKMETPCLIPYPDLSETEKEYDRKTALETLKAIMILGFEVHKKI